MKFDVIRRDDPWTFAPPTQHGVGPAPTMPSSRRQRRAHVLVWGAVLIYLCLTITGIAVAYGPIGGHSILAGLAGAVAGYLAGYVVNLGVVIAMHAKRIGHPNAQELIGLSEPQARALAEKLGYQLRVRSKDEPITADWSARRMTVDLSTGVVTDAWAG